MTGFQSIEVEASLHEGLVFSSNCAAPDLRNMYSKYFSHFNHDAAVAIGKDWNPNRTYMIYNLTSKQEAENKQRKRKKELAALKTRLAEG
ncbi:hypothetical protein ACHAPC_000819 [Botrytis cinerea]